MQHMSKSRHPPRCSRYAAVALASLLSLASSAPLLAADGGLHVPSPDWRDQIIYFAMIDRFDDGDPTNNDQGVGEYDPGEESRYSGGDLRGLARRLDYIQGLGVTALWITPPVANQWLNPGRTYSGYHGYWASDFGSVDAHYGTLADYQALSRALHGRGMYLVQDVVVNHVGDYLQCAPEAGAGDPAAHCRVRSDARGRRAPVQAPFDRNDPRDPAQRAGAIYHWTPDIQDFTDRHQELDFQLAGLDDLNTESPEVRRALRAVYGDWIREVGVDAFRIDTAFHVPAAFLSDFMHADDPAAPGMARVARATGRADFLAFGEGFGSDKPHADRQARKLDAYMREPGGLPSMINFPLYGTLGDVFARGRPPSDLAYRIGSMMALHADPHRMPSFVDNHDVERFLAGAGEPALRQALLALMTLPGIPVIYYGTEQGFAGQRRAMFAGGYGAGGRDHFDATAPLYRYLQQVIALRRGQQVFSRGTPTVLAANTATPGALAWRTDHGDRRALVVFNTGDGEALLDSLATGLAPGTVLRGLFGIDGLPDRQVVGADGRLSLVLPSRSGQVWEATAERAGVAPMPVAPTLMPLAGELAGDFDVQGSAPGHRRVQLVVDGDLAKAQSVAVDADGRWQARIRTGGMIDPDVEHRVVASDPVSGAVSEAQRFRVALDWRLRADAADPRGDDSGPEGSYTYPDDAGWREVSPADLERVRVWESGGALRIELTMHAISTVWNPANGFDHVAITAFLQLPGRDGGARVMPQQRAQLPADMRWHLRLRAHGWSNALFSSAGSSATDDGMAVMPVADNKVDPAVRTITFTLPAATLGNPASLSGAKLYVTTWDYDGGYRALQPEATSASFGGGDGARDSLWMDASEVIVLP